ncbi:coenzyme PQQ synthesis protein D [Methylopila jiangsuensis]|uniref:Coenzyme PQQ synthesis protein D n=1 Tax=Methylopila jiangsuensis TaxID=586230 RepID=A0A9W6JD25_9HYPH|nr:pyrroloquinoline quinone biosynthesis peptide chaperone PqqD [Methylopila jiangsuensis]MDR6285587.1 pyrroloquinoline quinone biosynthesis protein D [Methylopila jiangsuensis]GLK75345.1 coenzyme PQQ synthesis protein D [Methylopila jiangsuensis]
MTEVSSDHVPKLPRGVRLRRDEVRNEWLLLAPERVLKPNPIAVAVLERCDGVRSVAQIVDDLATAYAAPAEQIEADVKVMLADLADKRVLDLG